MMTITSSLLFSQRAKMCASRDLADVQYLRAYVRRLREKIEADLERPQYLLTETGIGYRLRAPD
jgi:DNA-binding response OmpR family regulator